MRFQIEPLSSQLGCTFTVCRRQQKVSFGLFYEGRRQSPGLAPAQSSRPMAFPLPEYWANLYLIDPQGDFDWAALVCGPGGGALEDIGTATGNAVALERRRCTGTQGLGHPNRARTPSSAIFRRWRCWATMERLRSSSALCSW